MIENGLKDIGGGSLGLDLKQSLKHVAEEGLRKLQELLSLESSLPVGSCVSERS